MKKTIRLVKTLALCATLASPFAPSFASIPIAWNVETTRVAPVTFDCYHGETLSLQPAFFQRGTPLQGSFTPKIYWQTNGMDSVYWITNTVTMASNTCFATFSGSYDPGVPLVRGFVALEQSSSNDGQGSGATEPPVVVNYRAHFTLRYRPSPGYVPNALPLPVQTIDCATVQFLNPTNAPWATVTCDTNTVNAIIADFDATNVTPRLMRKLDLPEITIPTNWIPVSIGNGLAEWKPNPGGGGGSLGKVTQVQDEAGNWHNVSSVTDPITGAQSLYIDPAIAPHEEMTVQQEQYRAVVQETMLYTNIQAEAATRLATDNDLYAKFNSISALGRFISTWDAEAGRPGTEPLSDFIEYKGGDYYIVGKVATNATNFIPNGTIYVKGSKSTTPAPDTVYVNDIYRHTDDGGWVHTVMAGVMVRWEQIDGSPTNSISYMNATTNLAFNTTTQTVTKAYVESLGIQSCDTNKVNDLIGLYDATNLTARINARASTNDVQQIIDTNIATNHVASYDLAQSKIAKPSETVPAGYSLVRGVTNLTDWVLLPSTNIVGYLGYIRDTSGNAYRVIAEPNPEGSIVASIEQTPTSMPIITIDELRDALYATNAVTMAALSAASLSATNYTDTATNALDVALMSAISATNAVTMAALSAASLSATNYTDTATNALSSVLMADILSASTSATNYTDSATNAATSWVAGNYLSLTGGVLSGKLSLPILRLGQFGGMTISHNDMDGMFFNNDGAPSTDIYFEKSDHSEYSILHPDGTPVLTKLKAETDYPAITNAYAYTDTATNVVMAALGATNTALRAAIADEATARAAADTALYAAISSTNSVTMAALSAASTSATNYTDAAKTALENAISAEATARANADALLIPLDQKAAASGVATLDANTKIPVAQLPQAAFNVREYANKDLFPSTGEPGNLYLAKDKNSLWRFDTTTGYVKTTSSVEWGAITGTLASQSDLQTALNSKQPTLPTSSKGKFLHANNSTGALEWSDAQEKLPEAIKDYYLHANFLDGHLEWKGIEGGDISNYNALAYKPIINGNVLTGGVNLASADLGLMSNLVFSAAENGKVLGVTNNALSWVTGGSGGGVDTNTVQYIIDENINTNHLASFELLEQVYMELSECVTDLSHSKRNYNDRTIKGKLLDAYIPVRKGDSIILSEDIIVQKESYGYNVYAFTGEFVGTHICKADKQGNLTSIEPNITLGGTVPAIGTKILYPEDYLALESQTQTNLVFSAAENGKVLGVTNNALAWVTGGGGGGGTTIYLNASNAPATTARIWTPNNGGTNGMVLTSSGIYSTPRWSMKGEIGNYRFPTSYDEFFTKAGLLDSNYTWQGDIIGFNMPTNGTPGAAVTFPAENGFFNLYSQNTFYRKMIFQPNEKSGIWQNTKAGGTWTGWVRIDGGGGGGGDKPYLPLDGSTNMTGRIRFDMYDAGMNAVGSTNRIVVCAGDTWEDGASFELYGKGAFEGSPRNGEFFIIAHDGTNSKILRGKPDGSLTWGTQEGGSKVLCAPSFGLSGQYLKSNGSGSPEWATFSKTTVGLGNVDNTSDANKPISTATQTALNGKQSSVAKLGSTTKPVYTSAAGTFAECSTYAGGTAVTLNGSSKGGSTASFYAPTSAGTSGQYLKSNGSGAPSWATASAYWGGTAVTLNGSGKGGSTASFYAPTSAGTSGQYLKSNGSGAPSWASITIPSQNNMYRHDVKLYDSTKVFICFSFVNNVASAYTSKAEVGKALYTAGYQSEKLCLMASGVWTSGYYQAVYGKSNATESSPIYYFKGGTDEWQSNSWSYIQDHVTQISWY